MPDKDQLAVWCKSYLPRQVRLDESVQLITVAGDAGFRSYFRLNSQPALIAVLAPPEHEDIPAFVDKALFLLGGSIHVPTIYAVDYQQGFMLIEDLGDRLLLPELNEGSVSGLYDLAEDTLLSIQALPPAEQLFVHYSREKLQQEMDLFSVWFVGNLLGLSLSAKEKKLIQSVFERLIESALEQPQVVVHRDYHARNLMLQSNGALGVIDFQDGVIGPVSYDLVSLLRDCYIRWPAGLVRQRVEAYCDKAVAAGAIPVADTEQFVRWFDLMGMQRHLKVLGIFARLWLRDGKPAYLDDLPLVMRYLLEQAAGYSEFNEFYGWFVERLLPEVKKQSWYQSWQTAGE